MEASTKAGEEEERRKQELEGEAALPKPKPAVMNVDVQGVLSATEKKTFAEAKLRPVKRALDGEPLWLYLKFKTKLGDYVLTSRDADDPSQLRYTLFAEVGPTGDITALNHHLLQFTKDDLAATELKINLAPGLTGRNRSMPVYLRTAASAKPGLWTNDLRISNSLVFPRNLNDQLVTVPFTLDLKGGNAKYRKLDAAYDSVVLRGTTDLSVMPIAGTFFDQTVKAAVVQELAAARITPLTFYFADDNWSEYAAASISMRRERKIFAAYTYKKVDACYYGVAEVVQKYDFATMKFGESGITLTNELAVPCAK